MIDLHLSAEAENQDTLAWKRWGTTPFSLGKGFSAGNPHSGPFPRNPQDGGLDGDRASWNGRLNLRMTSIREADGRHCVMSAVVMDATGDFLVASPVQLHPKPSDAGCEVPRGAIFKYMS